MFITSGSLVGLVGVEVEMKVAMELELETEKAGRWMSRHGLKWWKRNGTLTAVGKELHDEFQIKVRGNSV